MGFDTRFLATWVLTLNGERLHALSVDEETSYDTKYFLVPGEPSHYVDAKISVHRHRAINGSFEETLTVLNRVALSHMVCRDRGTIVQVGRPPR